MMDNLRLGVIQFDPILRVDDDGTINGLSKHIIPNIVNAFNMSYELVNSPDGGFGNKLADGNWSGILGSIQRGEADMFGIPVAANYERLEVVYLSPPLHTSYFLIVTALKTEVQLNHYGLFATFNLEVWLGVMFSMALLVFLSLFVDMALGKAEAKKIKKMQLISDHFWNVLASLFSEGTPKTPDRGVNNFLLFVWCLSVLTLMNAFTGHFKSQLTIIPEPKQVENSDDLSQESDDLKVMVWKDSTFENFVRFAEYPAFRSIEKKAVRNGGFIPVQDYFTWENYEDTVNGQSAFLVESTTFMYYLGIMCTIAPETKVHIAKESIYEIHSYFPYTKRFSKEFRDRMDRRLYQFTETGLKAKWIDYITDDSGQCTSGNDFTGERTLAFADLRAVFVLWLGLICLSIIIFILELKFKPNYAKNLKAQI